MKTLDVETARAQAVDRYENDPYIIEAREMRAAYKKAKREEAKLARKARSEQQAARIKAARAANPEPFRAYAKARYAANPEREIARVQKWQAVNPLKRRAAEQRRRARKRNAVGSHTGADRLAILKLQKYRCAYCRDSLKKDRGSDPTGRKRPRHHFDHIIPLSAGGTNDRANLQATCPTCNNKKYDKHPLVFARELGKLL